MIPLSFLFELLIFISALILMEMRMPGRIAAIGCFLFEIGLLVPDQSYLLDDGTTIVTSALPSVILSTAIFFMVIWLYVALANTLEYIGRDIFGRR